MANPMVKEKTDLTCEQWLSSNSQTAPQPVSKQTVETKAWFVCIQGVEHFAKSYPELLANTWALVEQAIAGSGLHPSIVPLRRVIYCSDGVVHLYDRITGENLSDSHARQKYASLPVQVRINTVLTICDALASVCDHGFSIVDWYEGNMIFDFETEQIWLFDWELSRTGPGFELEMQSNYGSSRLMAPEEFVRGSSIDQQSLVFNLGRFTLLNVPELADELAEEIATATYPAKYKRFETVRGFSDAIKARLTQVP